MDGQGEGERKKGKKRQQEREREEETGHESFVSVSHTLNINVDTLKTLDTTWL